MLATSVIASRFPEELNSAALVIGPTGVARSHNGTLYVADTIDNRITSIPFAVFRAHSGGEGDPVSTGGDLNAPLGLATTPYGDLLAVSTVTATWSRSVRRGPRSERRQSAQVEAGHCSAWLSPGMAAALYFVDDSENQLNVLR